MSTTNEAEVMAKVTGSVRCTVINGHTDADGNFVEDSRETWARPELVEGDEDDPFDMHTTPELINGEEVGVSVDHYGRDI